MLDGGSREWVWIYREKGDKEIWLWFNEETVILGTSGGAGRGGCFDLWPLRSFGVGDGTELRQGIKVIKGSNENRAQIHQPGHSPQKTIMHHTPPQPPQTRVPEHTHHLCLWWFPSLWQKGATADRYRCLELCPGIVPPPVNRIPSLCPTLQGRVSISWFRQNFNASQTGLSYQEVDIYISC